MKALPFALTFFAFVFTLCPSSNAQTNETYITEPFFEDFDGTQVNNTTWQVATWSEHGGQTGTERCYVQDGFLNMLFINDSQDGFLSSAIQTRDEFLYGKWETRIKPSCVAGILNSFYTIDWNNTADNSSTSNGTKQEIDIEFLTYTFGNPNGQVHFAVHADGLTSFNLNPDIELTFNPCSDFHVWGFEITPEFIEWFVDEQALFKYIYDENDITITAPYQLKLNVWSAVNWINGPPSPDVECVYLIDWIKFTPYSATAIKKINPNEVFAGKNFPNPFLNSTEIKYSLPKSSKVIFSLYNSKGQKIKTYYEGIKEAGNHVIVLNTEELIPGSYFYTIETNFGKIARKCMKI